MVSAEQCNNINIITGISVTLDDNIIDKRKQLPAHDADKSTYNR